MQTKSSYRVLNWTLAFAAMATLMSACVVTAGDGSDDDDGGEGGTSTDTAGKNSTAGTTTAGKNSGGTGGGSAGTTASPGGDGGGGGEPSGYVPGVCDDDLAVPSMPRDTALNADDAKPEYACRKCLKQGCKEEWSTCYGEAPTAACGYGSTKDSLGQFECIRSCFVEDMSGDETETVLSNCEDKCLDQCADKDQGFATQDTQALLGCGQKECLAECFTP